MSRTYENEVRVVSPLNGGMTAVESVQPHTSRAGFPRFEVPTALIPADLRSIGSTFLLRWGGGPGVPLEVVRER